MSPIDRRKFNLGVAGAAAGLVGLSCAKSAESQEKRAASTRSPSTAAAGKEPAADKKGRDAMSATDRMPTAFVPHGGGPWPVIPLGSASEDERAQLAAYMRSIADSPKQRPKALLVVSAHWEEPVPTVNSGAKPPMLYDYGGFPDEAYHLQWPAPGDPALAARVQTLLKGAGFQTAENATRGFDHGTFIPLMLAYPEADIPTVQLSLIRGLDPAKHLEMGRALAPLRDEGVFIIGSGNSYHNMRGFFSSHPDHREASERFDAWLQETTLLPAEMRDSRLSEWLGAPDARACHPREEHLIPLMVAAGAAGADPGSVVWSGRTFDKQLSAHHFGV